jgi:glycosyltransferase involved in cell wall biosynthesis
MTSPDISIVVCTYNRAAMLREALASLFDLQTDGRFSYEIVVIDNASTDATPRVIEACSAASKHPLRGVREPQQGIVPARNRGIRESRGNWIAFFDDDQLADPRWLAELYRGAGEKQSRVVGGAVLLALPAGCTRQLDPAVRMLLGEAIGGDQARPYGGRLTPGCGNLMVERSVFAEVGVFEPCAQGRGEDTDLFVRIERSRIVAWYLPTAIIHHLTPSERLQDDYLLRLARQMGEGIAERQAGQLGSFRFALLWVAKAARLSLVHWPRLILARIGKDSEAALGRRCWLAIDAAFLRAGCQVVNRKSKSTVIPAARTAATLVTGSATK